MNPFEILMKAKSIFAAIRPMLFSIVGGLVVSGMNRCSEQKPVNLIVTNQAYESQIRTLEKNQDSLIHSALPTISESLDDLSKRYDR